MTSERLGFQHASCWAGTADRRLGASMYCDAGEENTSLLGGGAGGQAVAPGGGGGVTAWG